MFSRINRLSLTHLLWMSVLILIGCTPSQTLPTKMVLPTQNPSPTVTQPAIAPILTQAPTLTATHEASSTLSISAAFTPSATITETATVTVTVTVTAMPTHTSTAILTLTPVSTPTLKTDAVVNNEQGIYLRTGPNVAFEPPIALIDDQTALTLLAISPNMLWYKVRTMQGQEGWAYSKLLKIHQEPPRLAMADVPLPTAAVVIVIGQAASVAGLPLPSNAGGALALNSGGVSARTLQIYQQGLQRGNNPRVIAKVGDSITSNQDFLIGYGAGRYNLGSYTSLQDSINYFSSEAFTRQSTAAQPGFSTASVLDPFSAPPDICQPNETPLMCEYRLTRPAMSIILLGSVDVQRYDANTYSNYLNQVVTMTINEGIVPVLTTFPYASNYYPAQSEAFNNVIRSIAANQQIPLIDLQAATLNLPNRGVGSDSFHLTQRSDDWIYLNGEQNQYGTTMRNLITLQMIDTLRRSLGMS